jgi:hypothetical protein
VLVHASARACQTGFSVWVADNLALRLYAEGPGLEEPADTRSSASGSTGKRRRSKESSVNPPTPLSPGRQAPPRSSTPASVLNELNGHKLVGGATRVVMLKYWHDAPRPQVSFGGQSVGLTSLRRTFYVSVENVTARAQSTRGSRKLGQDSDDELSAGDLDQDDEE